jgi:hypothetical protein
MKVPARIIGVGTDTEPEAMNRETYARSQERKEGSVLSRR